jgi:flavin reductase (DIM6/NTAB) family NADH-FMN oxidoreductase RutF
VSELEEQDALIRRVLWSLPSGLYLLGSVGEVGVGPWNLMTTNLVTQVATSPRVLALSIEREARTASFAESSGVLALSLLAREDRAVVRRFVKPVDELVLGDGGRPVSMAGQEVSMAPGGAPVLASALAWLDLVVLDQRRFESHSVFFASVAGAYAVDAMRSGSPSERTVELLRMEDTKMNYGG